MKTRKTWISLMLLLTIAFVAASAPLLAASAQDAPKPSVDINITKTDSPGEWYKNPMIIGAGVVILVLLVALASRGGSSGTTVVKS